MKGKTECIKGLVKGKIDRMYQGAGEGLMTE